MTTEIAPSPEAREFLDQLGLLSKQHGYAITSVFTLVTTKSRPEYRVDTELSEATGDLWVDCHSYDAQPSAQMEFDSLLRQLQHTTRDLAELRTRL